MQKLAKYEVEIGDLNASTHYGRLALKIGPGKKVLELGCNTGYLSAALTSQFGCTVIGIEIDPAAAAAAADKCKKVIVGDVEQLDLEAELTERNFDVILCADILEHLSNPAILLAKLAAFLAPNGYVLASVPNIAHGSVRLSLISGYFPYRDVGLLDKSHIRFFNRLLIEELFEEAGYRVVKVDRNLWSLFATEIGSRLGFYPHSLVSYIQGDYEAETYQFIVQAMPYQTNQILGNYQLKRAGTAPIKSGEAAKLAGNPELPNVDVVIFELPAHPFNDHLQAYMQMLNYPAGKLKFYLVKGSAVVEAFSQIAIESWTFGEHDFTSFRFLASGEPDESSYLKDNGSKKNDRKPANFPINKGKVLNQIKSQLQGEFVFVMDTSCFPTTCCLPNLVQSLKGDQTWAAVSATPEISQERMFHIASDGSISWAPLKCLLMRKEALDICGDYNEKLLSPAQEVEFSWRLWLKGQGLKRLDSAYYFSLGVAIPAGKELDYFFDQAQMHIVWGSLKEILGFYKYLLIRYSLTKPILLICLAIHLCLHSYSLLHKRWQRLKRANAQRGKKLPYGFHGRGYLNYGPL